MVQLGKHSLSFFLVSLSMVEVVSRVFCKICRYSLDRLFTVLFFSYLIRPLNAGIESRENWTPAQNEKLDLQPPSPPPRAYRSPRSLFLSRGLTERL